MNYQPLLRDYRQMIRVVRDKANSATSYQMGNAYGGSTKSNELTQVDPTQKQIRTLSEMNLPSNSPRRPELPAVDGFLSTRASTTHFHALNTGTRQYLSGAGGNMAVQRKDGEPGTKLRTELGHDAFARKVLTQAPFQSMSGSAKIDKIDEHKPQQSEQFSAFK
jgi:hypothetical protein